MFFFITGRYIAENFKYHSLKEKSQKCTILLHDTIQHDKTLLTHFMTITIFRKLMGQEKYDKLGQHYLKEQIELLKLSQILIT